MINREIFYCEGIHCTRCPLCDKDMNCFYNAIYETLYLLDIVDEDDDQEYGI